MGLIPPFHYQVAWQPRSWRPGEHPAAVNGEGGSFRGERLLADASQARFLSVRASLRDPFRRLWVKENQQRTALDLFVIMDVSRSMRVGGGGSYCQAAGDFLASAALSAYREGDRLGVVCASGRVDAGLSAAPSRRLPPLFRIAQAIRAMPQENRRTPGLDSVDALLDIWRRLPVRRSLVFVVSDYHAPAETWTSILRALRHHQVVPVVLQDHEPAAVLPRWGLVQLDDAESGRRRTLFMRPALQRRLTSSGAQRQADLDALFEDLGLRPCRLRQPFDPAQLTDYFHAAGLGRRISDAAVADPDLPTGTTGRRTRPRPTGQ
jgi:hypothetical protein